jgi:hypothetical protein
MLSAVLPAPLKGSLLPKLLLLAVAVLLLYTLESGKTLLFADTTHIPVSSAFFATPQASLDALVAADTVAAAPRLAAPAAAAPARPAAPSAPVLLSSGLPVQASARGNLGEPSVVTSEAVEDWLAHRWQAAANMQGEPLPGEHWLLLDLGEPCLLTGFLLDFEKAHAEKYTLQSTLAYAEGGGAAVQWTEVAVGSAARETSRSDMHIIHELPAASPALGRWVRLLIHEPATRWGTSVWRWHVYGSRVQK